MFLLEDYLISIPESGAKHFGEPWYFSINAVTRACICSSGLKDTNESTKQIASRR